MAPTPGRCLIALSSLLTASGGYIADWNETHVFNPQWPPHARYHNGQTMTTGLLLGLSSLFYLCQTGHHSRQALYTAAWLPALHLLAMLSGILYPGALPVDPAFGEGFPQLYICGTLLGMIGIGVGLEVRRVDSLVHVDTAIGDARQCKSE
ncbi:hypothetical protein BO70DRAFT_396330 [Aspergillus heteromorphus CBS 117.55]|uniref:Acetyltransferase n=1 Tax=Aspergillus heteromorphus CBS 117.55 TaxID=1448321 RepID=A0A317WAK1_9EURO|nr:uncharacterized protein BO70DRAFT_396330 [Aspergillus heteromorphus CBS 117.55]PWY82038.1 hypothetical protein BO70DRAFT_396330 [Aspergillus heteromorphus CBS 117.55]